MGPTEPPSAETGSGHSAPGPLPRLDDIDRAASAHRLAVAGALHPGSGQDAGGPARHLSLSAPRQTATPDQTASPDQAPESRWGTIVLLAPAEPGFWPHVTSQPEWRDGLPHPVDRWSRRVVGALADAFGADAVFPFGGPPWHPFHTWALQSGRAWESPVRLLIQETAGLMASYRGALAFSARLDLPPPAASPCDSCATRPCLSACPPGALSAQGYDVPACRSYLATSAGAGCLEGGCRTRRACPRSQSYGRLPDQSAYHMRQFQS